MRLPVTVNIAVLSLKGGIGKTTLATSLSHKFAMMGYLVQLYDVDLQGNDDTVMSEEPHSPTLSDVLIHDVPLYQALHHVRENLMLAPSDLRLADASKSIISRGMAGYTLLKRSLMALDKGQTVDKRVIPSADIYKADIRIFDCASMNAVVESVISLSNGILCPVETNFLSYDGLHSLIALTQDKIEELQANTQILGIVPYNVDQRYSSTGEYLDLIGKNYASEITLPVRTDAVIDKAQKHGKTIFEFAPNSKLSEDMSALAEQLEVRIKDLSQELAQELLHA